MSEATYKCKCCNDSFRWERMGDNGYCCGCLIRFDNAGAVMYEALKGVLEFLEFRSDDFKHLGETLIHKDIIEAALAKAKGESE